MFWILGFLAAAVATWALYFRADAKAAAPNLLTAEVTRGPVVVTVEATGTLSPVDAVEVGTQVSGTINELHADFNDRVKRGQVIARLDPAVFESQVAQARATVARLEADLQRARVQAADAAQQFTRARALAEAQLLPQTELDAAAIAVDVANANVQSAKAQLQQAQAALAQAEANLSHTIIRAPVDGIVLSRNVQVGQTVAAGLQAPTLFVLARDLETMQLEASVDEADIGRIEPGQRVRFRVDAYGNEEFPGTVSQVRLQPEVVQNVVSYTTVIDVPNPSGKLKPGMTATVSIEVARDEDALLVPAAALRFRPTPELLASLERATGDSGRHAEQSGSTTASDPARGSGPVVWRFDNGRVVPVPVEPGFSDGRVVAVRNANLEPGTPVVTGVASAQVADSSPQTGSGSPLLPSMPRRGSRTR